MSNFEYGPSKHHSYSWFPIGTIVKEKKMCLLNPSLLITGSPKAMHIQANDKKPAQIHFHSKRPHINTKMNDNINIDSTIAGSMNDNINMANAIAG
jgi:hypothetical protein